MAKVPYSPVPDVAAQAPGEAISESTPDAAFGENIGSALQHLGTSVGDVGNELFTRALAIQDLQNQADARNAVTGLMDQLAKPRADFLATKEKDAVNGLQPYLKSSDDLHKQFRATLTSPMAQRYFDQESSFFMRNNVMAASSHAGQEGKNYVVGTADAAVKYQTQNFVNPKNDMEFAQKVKTIRQQASTFSAAQGWSPEQEDEYVLTNISHTWLGRISTLAKTEPKAAHEMLLQAQETHQINQDDSDRAQDIVLSQNRAVGSRVLGDQIYGDGTKPVQEMFKEAEEKSPDLSYGDPKFVDTVKEYLRTRLVYDKSAVAQQQHTAVNNIYGQITTSSPTSLSALLALPGMQEAYNTLDKATQAKVPSWLTHWANTKNQLANDMEFNQLKSMAITEPQHFLGIDPSTWKVSPTQMVQLLEIRGRTTKGQEIDPYVRQAIGFMQRNFGSELHSLQIYNQAEDRSEGHKEYFRYIGALGQGINAWMEGHNGKPPTNVEMLEIGKDILKTHPETGMFGIYAAHGIFGEDRPSYDVPKSTLANVKAELQRTIPDVTDDEVYRAALRQIYMDLYGRSKPTTTNP